MTHVRPGRHAGRSEMALELDIVGADILRLDGLTRDRLSIADGKIVADRVGRDVEPEHPDLWRQQPDPHDPDPRSGAVRTAPG